MSSFSVSNRNSFQPDRDGDNAIESLKLYWKYCVDKTKPCLPEETRRSASFKVLVCAHLLHALDGEEDFPITHKAQAEIIYDVENMAALMWRNGQRKPDDNWVHEMIGCILDLKGSKR